MSTAAGAGARLDGAGLGPLLSDPATYAMGVPYGELARRRRDEPVGWIEEPLLVRHSAAGRTTSRGPGYWLVTRYQLVLEVSRNPEVFSSGRKGAFLAEPRSAADLEQTRQLLVNMDAPQHLRIRRVITSVFTPRAVRRMTEQIHEHAANLVTAIRAAGEFDVVADLAAELPLLVLVDLLGMPRADRHLLYDWSNRLVGFDDPQFGGGDIDAYRRTFAEAFRYALGLAIQRREQPADDLISRLATAEVDGARLSDRQFCNFWLLLVVAGNETTRHLISGSLQALAAHPEQGRRLADGEVGLDTAVDELIRWVTPIMQFRRTATVDTELAGQRIRQGDKVVLSYTSANRDEDEIPRAGELDLGRDPNPHLAFGVGPHFCLGSHLARLELRVLLEQLLPDLTRLAQAGEPVRLQSNFVNGLTALPARFT